LIVFIASIIIIAQSLNLTFALDIIAGNRPSAWSKPILIAPNDIRRVVSRGANYQSTHNADISLSQLRWNA